MLTRKEKIAKLEAIYAKALDVMDANLGVDKDAVYAACSAIQTASREIKAVEHVMRQLGELESQAAEFEGFSFEIPASANAHNN